MADTVKGACLCGAVQFEVTLPTLGCCHCHCIRTRGATVVRSRLLPAVVIPTAVAIGLLGVQAAFATADVCGVSSAKANDLMALSSANGIRDWIPPGVACSSDDPDYTSPLCQWRTTITQDRMIGDHRLIVASSAQPPQKAMDYVFVFACVDGRPTPTTHTRRDPDLKLDYAQYAQRGGEALELDRPREFQAKAPAADGGGLAAGAVVNGQLHVTRANPSTRALPEVPCNQVRSVDTNTLLTIPMSGWHGPGSYPATDFPPGAWYVTVGRDLTLGDDRRFIDLRAIRKVDNFYRRRHPSGCWSSDQLYVFGCVAGRLNTVFQDRYRGLKNIDHASAQDLSFVLWDLNGRDPYDPGREPNLSWERHLTYSWNPGFQGYILSSVRVGPPPADSKLPTKPPECVTPAQ